LLTKNLHGNAEESLDDFFFWFKEFLAFFKKSIQSGMFFTNQHLLVLDGHGNHVTLKTIKHAQEFGLGMIT
jgi:hypothetical protein